MSKSFRVARPARERYGIDRTMFALDGDLLVADVAMTRRIAARINAERARSIPPGAPTIQAGELHALGLIHEVFHHLIDRYEAEVRPGAFRAAADDLAKTLGNERTTALVERFAVEFPGSDGPTAAELATLRTDPDARAAILEELLLAWLANVNPAAEPMRELFDDTALAEQTAYRSAIEALDAYFRALPPFGPEALPLVQLLRAPALASPTSLAGQLRYIRTRWGELVGALLDRLLVALDVIAEEERALHLRFGGGGQGGFGGSAEGPSFGGLDVEPERFSADSAWMPRVVMIAKSTYVWLDQLSRRYGRDIRTLDAIPDEELDRLARQGITGLWLIGLWERSRASERIKRLRGNPDAVASAYSLDDYRIADDLGGDPAAAHLRGRAWARGIRLASDMVPNHMGIDSRWVVEHPDWFISLPDSPYPSYAFGGPDLSSDERVGIFLEDHYYDSTDAAVVFRRLDRWTNENRFVYHGNDGTSFPWNDTAQLDYLRADVREAVIQTILEVARRFPIIRFDAAMVLAKKHIERLWYPEPGAGGAIPSRAEHAIPRAEFDRRMPREFWREVVDRVAAEVPDTLLLAEAFWLLEGYFVRTLGMHRVYNSAFMHMLRDEDNAGYRRVIKETLEFDPEILKRYVNFMSNPDEKTAVEQFGKGDKYFGVASLLATMPGLPMLGHGQVEGFGEKYGMEFRRATLDEQPDPWLVERHEREVFPLFHRRAMFAEAADFLLYDFVTADGSVDENVFAYSNGRGATRSLVVYHNRFASIAGWIRDSAAFAVKAADGAKHLERRSLRDGLELPDGDDAFVAFRDGRTGLEYLRPAAELRERGLHVQLDAYRGHVFWEFRELRDGSTGQWRRVAKRLDGNGVASLEDALRELQLEPVHEPVRALLTSATATGLIRGEGAADLGALTELADRVATAVEAATGVSGRRPAYTSAVADRVAALASLTEAGLARSGPLAPVSAAFHDPWHRAVLLAWSVLEPLGRLAPGGLVGATSQAWFDELRLGPVVAGGLRAASLDESGAWSATERIRLLLALPRPSNVGGRTTRDRAARVATAWLGQPDTRAFVRVNRWEEVDWFGRHEWRELLDWSLLLDGVEASARGSGRDRPSIAASRAAVDALLDAGEASGYQVARLLQLVAPAPSSRTTAARRPASRGDRTGGGRRDRTSGG